MVGIGLDIVKRSDTDPYAEVSPSATSGKAGIVFVNPERPKPPVLCWFTGCVLIEPAECSPPPVPGLKGTICSG